MSKCLYCSNPLCNNNCPIKYDISFINYLVDSNKDELAYLEMTKYNSLPFLTSSLCRSDEKCVNSCILNKAMDAFDNSHVEKRLALKFNHDLKMISNRLENKKIAVIGSGASGINLSLMLARNAAQVTLYEKDEVIFPTLRYLIPNERFNKDYISVIEKLLDKFHVEVKLKKELGNNLLIEDLHEFDYIAICMGNSKANRYLDNTLAANNFIDHTQRYNLDLSKYHNPLIIGGGNVAIDCCEMLISRNITPTVIYRRKVTDMPGNKAEWDKLIKAGVKIIELASPIECVKEGVELILKAYKVNPNGKLINNRYVYENTDVVIEFKGDLVIEACGAKSDISYLDNIIPNIKELLGKDYYKYQNIYLGGDYLLGPSSFAKAIASSNKIYKDILYSNVNFYYGGSFDPVTLAHEEIIEDLITRLDKNTLFIEINPDDYDFSGKRLSPYSVRKEMVEAIINKYPNKDIRIIEHDSFMGTVEILKELNHPFLVCGMDFAASIKEWKNYLELLNFNDFYIYSRKNYKKNNLYFDDVLNQYQFKYHFTDKLIADVSSTNFRNSLNEEIISPDIKQIIDKYQLYRK